MTVRVVSRDELGPIFRMALLKGASTSVLVHLRRGASINGRDARGFTPLMIAAASGREEICRLLLAEGADPGVVTAGRQTACDLAVASGYLRLGNLLHVEVRAVAGPADGQDNTDAAPLIEPPGVQAPPESLKASEEDDGGWETEEAFRPAAQDLEITQAVIEVQSAVSATRARSSGEDWNEVKVELPHLAEREFAASTRTVFALVAGAFAREHVPEAEIERLSRRIPGLRSLLEDLGVAAEDDPLAAWISLGLEPRAMRSVDLDRLIEAETALIVLVCSEDARRDRVRRLDSQRLPDRDAEQSMFKALLEAKCQLLRLLASAPPGFGVHPDPKPVHTVEDELSDRDSVDEALIDPEDEILPDPAVGARSYNPPQTANDAFASDDVNLAMVDACIKSLASGGFAELAARLSAALRHYQRIRNRVVEAYLPLVLQSAKRRPWPGVTLDDLLQEGNIGLIRAVERFDITMGFRFATMAIWWIRQSLGRAADEITRTIRLPVHVAELVRRVDQCSHRLAVQLGRPPEDAEVAAAAGIPVDQLRRLLVQSQPTSSLEEPDLARVVAMLSNSETGSALDEVLARERRTTVSRILIQLGAREERIVRSRFGIGEAVEQTLEEVGQSMGVTRERIRQIEHKTMTRLSKAEGRFAPRLRALT